MSTSQYSQRSGSVTVSALNGGSLTLPERYFVTPADFNARSTVPSLCFLIQHINPTTQKVTRIVFDLGLRRDVSTYSEPIRKHCATRQPMTTEPDVVASLAGGGLTHADIDYVILSHVHYDHIGTPADFTSPHTTFIIGPGALDLLNGKTDLQVGSHSFFEKDLLPLDRTIELPHPTTSAAGSTDTGMLTPQDSNPNLTPTTTARKEAFKWSSLPSTPFPHTIDLLADGTIHLINAPGHLPGHINLLIKISPSSSVYLAGDACHDMRLFTGERDIATWTDDAGRSCCIHADRAKAAETIRRIRTFQQQNGSGANGGEEGKGERAGVEGFGEVEVVFAHNFAWEKEARERARFFPGTL